MSFRVSQQARSVVHDLKRLGRPSLDSAIRLLRAGGTAEALAELKALKREGVLPGRKRKVKKNPANDEIDVRRRNTKHRDARDKNPRAKLARKKTRGAAPRKAATSRRFHKRKAAPKVTAWLVRVDARGTEGRGTGKTYWLHIPNPPARPKLIDSKKDAQRYGSLPVARKAALRVHAQLPKRGTFEVYLERA